MFKGSKAIRVALGVLCLLGSLALIAHGSGYSREIRAEDADELAEMFGFAPFKMISDRQLIIDATFAGVIRREGNLYSTYDRSKPAGKRSCPT
jgi:hypothetical protein